jgi:non-canonical purine NTP pyrophosphatase (RdgB/HAM1 family)
MEIAFVTGNAGKWEIAKDIFAKYGLNLTQVAIDTPEIQSLDVKEVASYSARYAAQKLGVPVIKSDVGYYITALGGFPGPFIKYVNQTLSDADLLRLMDGVKDRTMIVRECLAFAAPDGFTKCVLHEQQMTIAEQSDGQGSSIDKIMILDGYAKTKAASDPKEVTDYWKKSLTLYHNMAQFLKDMK